MRLDKREYLRKKANELAFNRMTGFEPRLAAISSAVQVIPGMDNNVLLHSGPSALLGC